MSRDEHLKNIEDQIKEAISDLHDYNEQLGDLYNQAKTKDQLYRLLITIASATSTVLALAGILYTTITELNFVKFPIADIILSAISLLVSIVILYLVQGRLSADHVTKATEYISARETAAKLASRFQVEWQAALLKFSESKDLAAAIEVSERLFLDREKLATRAHRIGLPVKAAED